MLSVGDVFLNKHGDVALVTEYISCTEVYVVFDGYDKTVKFNASNLKAGRFRNKEKPDNFGTTLGGTYCTKVHKSVYARWRNMIRRCHEKHKGYEDVSVCQKWMCFDNYAEWFYSQKACNSVAFEVDKDISGAKLYSPETCFLVPVELNVLFSRKPKRDLARGVYYVEDATDRPYLAVVGSVKDGKRKEHFHSEEDARRWYLDMLKVHIESVIHSYKDLLEDVCIERIRKCDLSKL